jgi:hypothetical protein
LNSESCKIKIAKGRYLLALGNVKIAKQQLRLLTAFAVVIDKLRGFYKDLFTLLAESR